MSQFPLLPGDSVSHFESGLYSVFGKAFGHLRSKSSIMWRVAWSKDICTHLGRSSYLPISKTSLWLSWWEQYDDAVFFSLLCSL